MRHPISTTLVCVTIGASLVHCGSEEQPSESACGVDCGTDGAVDAGPGGSNVDGAGSADATTATELSDASGTSDASDASEPSGPSGIDPSFGSNGAVLTGLRDGSDMLIDVVRQPDGKLVAVGTNWGHADAFVVRFGADGAPDPSFGVAGVTIVPLALEGQAIAVALQSDGKIVVLAREHAGFTTSSVLVRLDTNGAFDPTWGTAGRKTIPELPGALAIQSDDKILLASGSSNVTRLTTSGALDTTFASGLGTATASWGLVQSIPIALRVDSTGRIVVLSTLFKHLGIARFTPSGVLDDTFDGDGVLETAVDFDVVRGHPLAVQSDGKIVTGGYASGLGSHVVARYGSTGALDTTFDGDGYAVTGGEGALEDIEIDTTEAEAKIVVLRGGEDGSSESVYRFTLGGVGDGTFGTSGKAALVQDSFTRSHALAIGDGGKVFLGGEQRTRPPAYSDSYFLPRFLGVAANGTIDTAWATNGRAWVHSRASVDEVHALLPTGGGGVLAVGRSSYSGFNGAGFTLAKYTAAGALDTAFGTDGVRHHEMSAGVAKARAVALDSTGRILVAGGENASIARFTSTGALDETFGSGGTVSSPVSHTYALAVDSSDRLIVGGTASSPQGYVSVLTRRTSSGGTDSSFGTNGSVQSTGGSNVILAVALRSDGKILVAGAGSPGFLARYDVNGGPDASFQSTPGSKGVGYALDIAPDGKVLVAGASAVGPYLYALDTPYTGAQLVVGRFLENGAPDTSFATDGFLTTSLSAAGISSPVAYAVRAGANGHVYVAGTGWVSGAQRGFVLRLLADGTIDTAFGSQGAYLAAPQAQESAFFALARQSDGKQVAGGFAYVSPSGRDLALARFLP